MQNKYGTYVLFSIDNADDLRTMAKFLSTMDKLRALDKLKGEIKLCIGSYQDVMEYSFLCRKDDFEEHVRNSGFIDNQDSILVLEGDDMQASIEFLQENKRILKMGRLVSVDKDVALTHGGWTYVIESGLYYTGFIE